MKLSKELFRVAGNERLIARYRLPCRIATSWRFKTSGKDGSGPSSIGTRHHEGDVTTKYALGWWYPALPWMDYGPRSLWSAERPYGILSPVVSDAPPLLESRNLRMKRLTEGDPLATLKVGEAANERSAGNSVDLAAGDLATASLITSGRRT